MSETKEQRLAFSCGHGVAEVFTKVGFFVVKKQMYHRGTLISDETVIADTFIKKISLTIALKNRQDSDYFWSTKDPEANPKLNNDVLHLVLRNGDMRMIGASARNLWPKDALEFNNYSDAETASLILKAQR